MKFCNIRQVLSSKKISEEYVPKIVLPIRTVVASLDISPLTSLYYVLLLLSSRLACARTTLRSFDLATLESRECRVVSLL